MKQFNGNITVDDIAINIISCPADSRPAGYGASLEIALWPARWRDVWWRAIPDNRANRRKLIRSLRAMANKIERSL